MKSEKVTSYDIAQMAGVSQPTVSRALRNSPVVSEETREKIKKIAKDFNYKVDINARNLRSQKSKTIALLMFEDLETVDSPINQFFVSMLGNITRATTRLGYDLLISFQQSSDDWGGDYEDVHRADGIIFLGYGDYMTYIEKISKLDKLDANFITWGPVLPNQPGYFIGCDNVQSAYMATKHLIDLGYNKIAFFGEVSEHHPEFYQRYMGYTKAHEEAGLKVDQKLQMDCKTSEKSGYRVANNLMEKNVKFDALFGASDLIVIGAIKAFQDKGLIVPQDIAVVGFDDIPTSAYINPPITTIKQDTVLAGETLVENLIKLIDGQVIESILMPTKLIIRESCGANLPKE